MESTKKGMPLDTPNLSNYRTTGESLSTEQSYIISNSIDELSFFFIDEIISSNNDLKRLIKCLGSDKWSDFLNANPHIREYEEQFDDADYYEHFGYDTKQAEIEARCEFITSIQKNVVSFIDQFNTEDSRFYTGAIVELSKHLKR